MQAQVRLLLTGNAFGGESTSNQQYRCFLFFFFFLILRLKAFFFKTFCDFMYILNIEYFETLCIY